MKDERDLNPPALSEADPDSREVDTGIVIERPAGKHYPRVVICIKEPWPDAPFTVGNEYVAGGLAYYDEGWDSPNYMINDDDRGKINWAAGADCFIDKEKDFKPIADDNTYHFINAGTCEIVKNEEDGTLSAWISVDE